MTNQLISNRDAFSETTPEKRITVNNREWGVIHCPGPGNCPILVLLPGTLGRADIFWHQIDALKNRVNILALSYPDAGSVAGWVQDISALMKMHEFSNATLLGSSLGGFVAQYFAATLPHKIENLIAANTLSSVAGLNQFPPYSLDLNATPIETIRQGFASGMNASLNDNPERADLVELLLREVGGRITEHELRARLKALKFGPELPDISISAKHIFTVESQDDPLIPPPMREAVRDKLNPARSYRFATGSHFPYITHPHQYTALIEECLGIESQTYQWNTGTIATC